MSINIENISKSFGGTEILKNINLHINSSEMVALLGPSGSGKTTMLRIIAGLEFPDYGSISYKGEDFLQKSAKERNVGFVFQHYALFKHMSVFKNIAFGLEVLPKKVRPSTIEITKKVNDLLHLVRLEQFTDRYPSQLSGGQKQRVALARALAVEPKVLLLDEPFGALDAKVRKELRQWIHALHKQMKITSIFVTHDQDEAMEVADCVVIMNHGRIEQIGTPAEIIANPANEFVADFISQ